MKIIKYIIAEIISQLKTILKFFTPKGRDEMVLDNINEKLAAAILDQEKEKKILKRKIFKHFGRQFLFGSKYIKTKGKSEHHTRLECERLFGEDMRKVNLKLTKEMKLE